MSSTRDKVLRLASDLEVNRLKADQLTQSVDSCLRSIASTTSVNDSLTMRIEVNNNLVRQHKAELETLATQTGELAALKSKLLEELDGLLVSADTSPDLGS